MTHQAKRKLGVTLHRHGADFYVWAPFAKNVTLSGTFNDMGDTPMERDDSGCWFVSVENAEAGQFYKYHIDTGDEILERNDPRARQLTDSDVGMSVIASEDFKWDGADVLSFQDPSKQIIYEMHVGTFNRPDPATAGTFADAIEKLDYLKRLGITSVELMPITSMATSNGWGYAPNHIFSVENAYGGRHGLMNFVKACHQNGIGVILDVVYNHFFEKTDLWQFDGWSENGRGGIYFYNDERGDTPWGGRPDYGRPEVRDFILDNVAMWFTEYHIDGLRIDSTIYMRNTAGQNDDPAHDIPDAWTLLGDITALAKKIKPDALLIAEDCAGNAGLTKSHADGGCGFDTQWELGFPHVLRDALGLTASVPTTIHGIVYELAHSYNGNAYEKTIFSDSHDTAANGSVRLNEAVTPGNAASVFAREKALLADAITLTSPGIPMLLQGQEFLQKGNFNDWKMLEWDKAERFSGIVLAHEHLIKLRLNAYGNTAGLLGQSTSIFHTDDDNHVIGYHRYDRGGPGDDTLVIANFSNQKLSDYHITLPLPGDWRVRFNSSWKGYNSDFRETTIETADSNDQNIATVILSPYGLLVLSQDA